MLQAPIITRLYLGQEKMADTKNLVLIKHIDNIAIVTLNRPQALNALSAELRKSIVQAFKSLAKDERTQVIIITGAGRAFTVGLDLKELGEEIDSVTKRSAEQIDVAMASCPQPIIGAVNGFAITGGFEIALMCDFLIASTNAQFADTHARVGVVPGWGISQRLPRLIGINRAKEVSLTGNYLDAKKALDWGLINQITEPEDLLTTCIALGKDILSTDPTTRNEIKKIMDQGWLTNLEKGLAIEREASQKHRETNLRPEEVAMRRKGIQERGRSQSN